MNSRTRVVARVAALAFIFSGAGLSVAHANSIGPDCTSCQGSVYTLANLGQVADIFTSDNLNDTWRIALSIDTSAYTGAGVRIDEIAVKVSSAVNRATLVSAPGGLGTWEQIESGGINADGCSGSGSGFDCADWKVGSSTGAFPIPSATVFTWILDIDVVGDLLTGEDMASIKARYVDALDAKVGALVSENITLGDALTPVPEPGSLLLIASGITAIAARRRARRHSPAR